MPGRNGDDFKLRKSATDTQRTGGSIVLASYNVHAWIGMDFRRNVHRVLSIVRDIDADVIGLQEVSLPLEGSLFRLKETLEQETGMFAEFGPTMIRRNADFGNLILSRHPIERIIRRDLTFRGREPRGAVEIDVVKGEKTMRVCTTHLGVRAVERVVQTRKIIRMLYSKPQPDMHVLMGDFNEWMPGSPSIRMLLKHFDVSVFPASYPSLCPVFSLDRILIRPQMDVVSMDVYRKREARIASDHLPVVVRLTQNQRTVGADAANFRGFSES